MRDMNACKAGHVCLSVRMIPLENLWTDLGNVWYGSYSNGIYPKVIFFFNFLQLVMSAWREKEGEEGRHCPHWSAGL
jgi:hypothetical protein